MSRRRKREKLDGDLGYTPEESHYAQKETKQYRAITAKNAAQKHYLISMQEHNITFGVGPAGTGKTYLCGAVAAQDLVDKKVEKIVITRPVVEAEEALGFLPGSIEEKFAPYFRPFRDVLDERLGKTHVDYLIKLGYIEIAPLAYMRGRSFKNCWVVLDEAQNTTPNQMKLFLTRLGEGCKVVVNGDLNQKDILGQSGLEDAVRTLEHLTKIGFSYFTKADIVRSGIVQEIVEAYEDAESLT